MYGMNCFDSIEKQDLLFNGTLNPPKYVIARANIYANGEELREFSGGRETNSFLEKLDLKILYHFN